MIALNRTAGFAISGMLIALIGGSVPCSSGQEPVAGDLVELDLSDGEKVFLVPVVRSAKTEEGFFEYEYLPSIYRVVEERDGQARFFIETFGIDADSTRKERDEVAGGVLHALLEWGLDDFLVELAEAALARRCNAGHSDLPDSASRGEGNAGSSRISGLRVADGRINCGKIRGAARIAPADELDNARLHVRPGYDHPDSRVSHGSVSLLSGQRMAVAFDLDPDAAAWLGKNWNADRGVSSLRSTPPGVWRLESDLELLSDGGEADLGSSFTALTDFGMLFRQLQRRDIYFRLDENSASGPVDFEGLLDHVTIMFAKEHEDGTITRQSQVLGEDWARTGREEVHLSYGWREDQEQDAWLSYRYRVVWSYFGGARADSGWLDGDSSLVSLDVPHERRAIQLAWDAEAVAKARVESVEIEVSHSFFGQPRHYKHQIGREQLEQKSDEQVELTLPQDWYERGYDYKVEWRLTDGRVIHGTGNTSQALIFIDKPLQGESGS